MIKRLKFKLKMRLFFLITLIVFSSITFAQTINVKEFETNTPLEFVSVVGLPSNSLVSTNIKGEVNLTALKQDSVVVFSIIGYKTKKLHFVELQRLENKTLFLTPSFLDIDEIVVSATRWEQNGKSAPHKKTSIKSKDFKFLNPQTAADLLSTSGDVFIQKSQQGGGSPMIRGFATNRLLYSVDGVRMNTAIFRSGNLQNVISLDAFSTEKVDILFGPGAIIYGSDAIGGVMSFTTLKPTFNSDSGIKVGGNAVARFSTSNSEFTSHLDVSLASKKWGFLTSYTNTNFGDLKMGKNGPSDFLRDSLVVRFKNKDVTVKNTDPLSQIPTAYSQNNFMQKLAYQPNKNENYAYAFHFSETSEYDRYDNLVRKKDGVFRFGEWKYGPQKWIMHQLSATYKLPKKMYDKVQLNLAYQRFEESRIDRALGSNLRETKSEKVDAYSFNVDFLKQINSTQKLFYGIESVINHVGSSAITKDISTLKESTSQSRYPNSIWNSNAVYATYQWKATESLTFDGGVRLNQFSLSSEFDTTFVSLPFKKIELNSFAFSGSLGAVYRPRESLVFSSHISSGFRAPNVDDIGKFDDQSDGSVIVPNNELSAEFAYNFDLGSTAILNDFIKIDVTLFYTYLNNALVRRDYTFNGSDSLFFEGETRKVESIQNAAIAQVYGAQAGLEVKINRYFRFSQQINFQKGEEELEDGSKSPSRHAAPLFGLSKITFKKKKLRVMISLIYSDEVAFNNLNIEEQEKTHIYGKDSNGNPYSPSWYTFNLKTQYIFSSVLTANLGLENLTNQRYRTYSSGITSAGRNLVFSLNAKF